MSERSVNGRRGSKGSRCRPHLRAPHRPRNRAIRRASDRARPRSPEAKWAARRWRSRTRRSMPRIYTNRARFRGPESGSGLGRAVSPCGTGSRGWTPVRSDQSADGPGNGASCGYGPPGNARVPPANGTARPPQVDAGETRAFPGGPYPGCPCSCQASFPGRAVGIDAGPRVGQREEALLLGRLLGRLLLDSSGLTGYG